MAELKLENVSYYYKNGRRPAVKEVSCVFEGGYLNAVAGPSGSGKTTLLSIVAGLDRPTQGSIYFDGNDLAEMDLDRYRREDVSMIFQAFQLFPLLRAVENVSFPMELNGNSKKEATTRAEELLVSVGIDEEKHNRFPSNLSGGEQQRVAIARTLGTGAQVLLADEPTGNLDTANGEQIVGILKRLAHEQGYCVVVVTHDLAIAEASDKVWGMTDGALTMQ
jgi:putative ABC transport system ATP-binding protein